MRCGSRIGKHVHKGDPVLADYALFLDDGSVIYLSKACVEKLTLRNLSTLVTVPVKFEDERVLTSEK